MGTDVSLVRRNLDSRGSLAAVEDCSAPYTDTVTSMSVALIIRPLERRKSVKVTQWLWLRKWPKFNWTVPQTSEMIPEHSRIPEHSSICESRTELTVKRPK